MAQDMVKRALMAGDIRFIVDATVTTFSLMLFAATLISDTTSPAKSPTFRTRSLISSRPFLASSLKLLSAVVAWLRARHDRPLAARAAASAAARAAAAAFFVASSAARFTALVCCSAFLAAALTRCSAFLACFFAHPH